MIKKNQPIGVFDSGLGGLTVVKALSELLPNEDIVYYGDTARVPYGTKSKVSIIRFSKENTKILMKHKVKMIVVACNSSSSYALSHLRKMVRVPVLGVIAPGVKKALTLTQSKKIGVIATPATVNSKTYTKLIKKKGRSFRVVEQACPLFVPLVEEGWSERKITQSIAKDYLRPIIKAKCDVMILGCTHYPLLKKSLKKVLGPKVQLIDSAQEVANMVKETLHTFELAGTYKRKATYQFLISDDPQHFRTIASKFNTLPIKNVSQVSHP